MGKDKKNKKKDKYDEFVGAWCFINQKDAASSAGQAQALTAWNSTFKKNTKATEDLVRTAQMMRQTAAFTSVSSASGTPAPKQNALALEMKRMASGADDEDAQILHSARGTPRDTALRTPRLPTPAASNESKLQNPSDLNKSSFSANQSPQPSPKNVTNGTTHTTLTSNNTTSTTTNGSSSHAASTTAPATYNPPSTANGGKGIDPTHMRSPSITLSEAEGHAPLNPAVRPGVSPGVSTGTGAAYSPPNNATVAPNRSEAEDQLPVATTKRGAGKKKGCC